jgi:hypothetical protein
MAGRIVKQAVATITGVATTGYITVASTTGFYAGAKGWLNAGGQPSQPVIITEVASATSMGVRFVPEDNFSTGQNSLKHSYGRSNPTPYNGGTITMNEQFVFNPNDKPLD